jgi:hypothetical protein
VSLLRKDVKPIDAARGGIWLFLSFFCLGLFCVCGASQKIQQNTEVLKYSSSTQGQVTYVLLTGKGAPSMHYAYEAMGKEFTGVTEPDVRSNYLQDPHVGDSIDVLFSTKHPGWSIAGDPKRQPDYGLSIDLGLALVVIGLIGAVVSKLVVTRLEKSEVMQHPPALQSRQQKRALEREQRKHAR